MAGIGRTVLPHSTGRPVRVSSDGYPEWKAIGVTVAWELVTAAVSDTTLADDTPVRVGEKAIPFGTVMVKVTSGGSAGKYAPYKSDATDGRQTLTRGDVGILDITIKQSENYVLGANVNNEHVGLIEGGEVFSERLQVGSGTQPTLANVLTALPRLRKAPAQS